MLNTYEDFIAEILRMTGIDLAAYKERQMKRRIDSLISKNQFDTYPDYVNALKINREIYEEFINYITINVSEFFRNYSQWEVLEKEVIPYLLSRTKTPKIWSAACSTGEEPYSLAMLLSKFIPMGSIKIIATDIDKQILTKAQDGLYAEKCIDTVPPEYKKFFEKEGDFYRVKDEVKKCISFNFHNLLSDPYPPGCDMIVCRNVLIYFTEEAKVDIYNKFNKSMTLGGILFVGSTEQIILCNKYNFAPLKTFFYKKEGELGTNQNTNNIFF